MALNNRSGSGFTNLQAILNANKNNRLGQAVGTGISKVGQQVRGDINQAGQQFQQQIGQEKQRQAGEETYAGGLLNQVSGGGNIAEPDVARFEQIRGAQYKGPQGLQNSEALTGRAGEAQGLGQATSSAGGRMGLLQRFAGTGPKYTQGQQRLDSLLLGQTGAGQLQGARRGVAGLGQYAQNQATAAGEVSKEAQGGARGVAERTIGKLGGAVSEYDVGMQARAKEEQAKRDAQTAAAKGALGGGELSDETYGQLSGAGLFDLGDTIQLGKGDYSTDLGRFVTAGQQATKQNVQSQADAAKIAALSKLSGQSLDAGGMNALQQFSDPSQAGSLAKSPAFGFDKFNAQAATDEYQNKFKGYTEALIGQKESAFRGLSEMGISPNSPIVQEYLYGDPNKVIGKLNSSQVEALNNLRGAVRGYEDVSARTGINQNVIKKRV